MPRIRSLLAKLFTAPKPVGRCLFCYTIHRGALPPKCLEMSLALAKHLRMETKPNR